jgi:rhodanese-related sulfurtransferase
VEEEWEAAGENSSARVNVRRTGVSFGRGFSQLDVNLERRLERLWLRLAFFHCRGSVGSNSLGHPSRCIFPPPRESDIGESARNPAMLLTLAVVGVVALGISLGVRVKRRRDQHEMEQHSITAEELHTLLASDQEVLLFDVCQPLDLLAYPEMIPKAKRIAPDEVLARPTLIPKERDAVVYCTCPSDKTSRLKGGLAAWKTKGYPVEPYKEVFHLNSSLVPRSQ